MIATLTLLSALNVVCVWRGMKAGEMDGITLTDGPERMLPPRRVHLLPPVSYQGGKRRQAPEIVRHMALYPEQSFVELCSGSGAVSLELISRGHAPEKVVMVDSGPWGDVWRLIGEGAFDMRTYWSLARSIPDDPLDERLTAALGDLAASVHPDSPEAPYCFLLLQSGSFGGKAVGVKGGKWRTHGFRPPGSTTYPPLVPRPSVLAERLERIAERCVGLTGVRADVCEVVPVSGAVAYIDPPYASKTGYGKAAAIDLCGLARAWAPSPFYVSEAFPLNADARAVCFRERTGISSSATATAAHEYLSVLNAGWTSAQHTVEQTSLF